jgi:hypothetical protein
MPRTRVTLSFLGNPGVGPLVIVALSLVAGIIGVWGYDWRWGMIAIMVAGLVFVATTEW